MASKPKEEKKGPPSVQDILESVIAAYKEDCLNDFPDQDYKVTSGSIKLDYVLGGGFGPGIHRFGGVTEGGKTSECLEILQNFLDKFPTGRGLYFRAEGRLSPTMRERTRLKFVTSAAEWVAGTVFVLDTNIYEVVAKMIAQLVTSTRDSKLCFVVDSLDGLIPKGDYNKEFGDATKVAGGAVIAGLLVKKLGSYTIKFGHMVLLISQVRAKVDLDKYSTEPTRQLSGTGGNALQHAPDTTVEFWTVNPSDRIMEKKEGQPDINDNKILGHWAKARIKKSTNQSTGYTVQYPIKYGRKGGSNIWIEKEITDTLIDFGYIEKSGTWMAISADLAKEVEDFCGKPLFQANEKAQGADKLELLLCQSPEHTSILKNFILERVIK